MQTFIQIEQKMTRIVFYIAMYIQTELQKGKKTEHVKKC